MACSIKSFAPTKFFDRNRQLGFPPSIDSIQFGNFHVFAQPLISPNQIGRSSSRFSIPKSRKKFYVNAMSSFNLSKSMRWWEKAMKPNMIEIKSAQELVDTLKNCGDRLVIIDFYSPACGGCRALHPKISQLAESNPDAIFLTVNHEELKKMCHALHIHVLPFFRFYRGSKGRLCSFSCTVSTIKKFREALAKYNSTDEQSSLSGTSKGLDESELITLASIGEISMIPEKEVQSSIEKQKEIDNLFTTAIRNPTQMNITQNMLEAKGDNNSMLVG